MQIAELHFNSQIEYDSGTLIERVEELLASGVKIVDGDGDAVLLFHEKQQIAYKDGSVPAQTAILKSKEASGVELSRDCIEQSWTCEDAAERIQASQSSLMVTEMLCRSLPASERLRLFHGVLQALAEITQPSAIVFRHSQQVVAGSAYLQSCSRDPIYRSGSLNVRFFNISNSDTGDMLMDLRGLDEIGLHDLQCHFRELEPNDVSEVLLNTAVYIFENGAVIESGQTITGTEPDSRWVCQFENSLLEPQRELLDFNPGPPFAAGNRG